MTPRLRVRRVANGHDKTCPTCGQTLPRPRPHGLRLSPLRTRLFEIVQRAGDNGITTADIADMLYADHPDGGPQTAHKCIHVHVYNINKKLRPAGYEIKARNWGRLSDGDYSTGEYVYAKVRS
jgi:hypothetical protein